MIIDFPNIPEQRLPNFKGGEKEYIARMFFDGQNRIMYGRLEPGASIGLHTHLAGQGHRQSACLGQRRFARRQPGAD